MLDTPQPAVYCVPGRPATIVLTTGALAVLDRPQLLAVLAHEHAHLAGRHHLLVTLGKAARAGFPGVPLFSRGADEVARLAEMRADDVAARRSGRDTLLQALVAMGTGRPLAAPSASLAATGGAVTARVRRLLDPPSGTSRAWHGLALAGVLWRWPPCPCCSPSSPETAALQVTGVVPWGCAPALICWSDYRRQVTVVYDCSD